MLGQDISGCIHKFQGEGQSSVLYIFSKTGSKNTNVAALCDSLEPHGHCTGEDQTASSFTPLSTRQFLHLYSGDSHIITQCFCV